MSSNSEHKDIKRKAIQILMGDCFLYASLVLGIVVFASGNFSIESIISNFIFFYLVFGVYLYNAYYSNNIELHKDLRTKLGQAYLLKLSDRMDSAGLRKMIYSRWFRKIGREAWPGKL